MATALNKRSRLLLAWVSVGAVPLLGLVDYVTGYDLSLSLFYLGPIFVASWYVGRRTGVAVAVVSALVWIAADVASGHVVSSPILYVWNTLIRFGFFLTVTTLLTRLRAAYLVEQDMARTDRMTGAANLRRFTEYAEVEFERARRCGRAFTVAYMDLDNFKAVNDKFGHLEGDEVLKTVTRTVMARLRGIDIVARIGGDEFALFLPDTDQAGAKALLHEVREVLLEQMQSHEWPVTFSIGVVTFNAPPGSVADMLAAADKLMYEVKAGSKDAVSYDVYDG